MRKCSSRGRSTPAFSRDLSYLKSKSFDQLTSAELSAAKEEAKKLKLTRLVACADPGNMPLSDEKREGFENKIAEVVGRKMGVDISFFWRPYIERGLTRETFDNNECQVLLGMPTDYPSLLTTVPIYRSTYVLAYREDSGLNIKSFDDQVLHTLKIGVFQHSAMRSVLAARGIKENVDLQIVSVDADLEPEQQPHVRLVVADEDPERHAAGSSSRAMTPPAAPARRVTSPPSERARDRAMASPSPRPAAVVTARSPR